MAQPKHVRLSSRIPAHARDEVAHLIELTAEIARAPLEHTEVHVKLGSRRYGQTTGYAYYNFDGKPFDEQEDGSRIHCQPGICELVTIKLQPGFDEYYSHWPTRVLHYWRYKTFPHTPVHNWQEEFVYIVRHEFQHIAQFHRPRLASGRASASELECETAAIEGLEWYRVVLALQKGYTERSTVGHAARR